MRGAASPMARESARMVPVSAPGRAIGSRWLRTTPERESPLAYGVRDGAQGLPRGDNDDGQDEQGQRQGAREHALAAGYGPQVVHEQGEAQEPVDDRGDPGQVGDVDLDDPRQPVVGGVLLQVDGGTDTHRNRQERYEQQQEQRPEQGRVDTRVLGERRRESVY